ncbi:S8 family serine peptidase [Lachnospiraceae bacterium DSM 108991]|uniref:S8 family serine peptidase n=1 Tax=Claveliimonas monacensis TaxID=2779351 RepID=A0ABR9RMW3_9FIRM|nr:S8 family serine peptidase [Claveliimonas monacensis]MBE5063870.1 S8 family serine peptidase [Claveliimonas monacensis]
MKRKVAVIDSGINSSDPLLVGKEIQNLCYEDGEVRNWYICTNNMHGTEVVKVLLHEAPDIELLSVRVLQEDNRCMISAVLKAIRFCIDSDVDVINLSLGCCSSGSKRMQEMKALCNEAEERGIAVFAADHNLPGRIAYPANFDNVVGVNTSEVLEDYCQVKFKDKLVNFSENMVFIPDDTQCVIRKGNSFLCPFLVGLFCRYIGDKDINTRLIEDFMSFLSELSKKENIEKIFFDKKKAQEMNSLNGKRLLYFADDWDFNNQQMFNIYKKTTDVKWCFKDIYKRDPSVIKKILLDADVFFFGALSNEFIYRNEDYLRWLIEYISKQKINVIMVFPLISTFRRIQLSEENGNYLKCFYK